MSKNLTNCICYNTARTYNEPLELATTAQKGTYIKNLSFDVCRNTMDAITGV